MLENLKPERVFYYFEKMCEIPHGSGNTKQISDFCVNFAKDLGLEYHQDSDNNVIIIKEAAAGYENAPAVILQGHLDMVCEKTADCNKDMEKEGLDVYVDGDEVRARNTTLGGDNGIAVAMAMAILEDKSLKHPRVEAVFTVDEEIGLLGAGVIDVSPLQGKMMINIDSELEGVFTVSCAGGNTTEVKIPVLGSDYSGDGYFLHIRGLAGGHSGVEIHKQRANSNVIMGRILRELDKACGIRIISVNGGLKDNAIPLDTKAKFVCKDDSQIQAIVEGVSAIIKKEYESTDPDMKISLSKESFTDVKCFDEESTDKMITMLYCSPNGVQKMSLDIDNLVQTSLNLGIVKMNNDYMLASFCVRSSVGSERADVNEKIRTLGEFLGGSVEIKGDYPGWEYRKDSALRDCMIDVFKQQYGKEPVVEAVHAGLECGMFAGKIEDLDCVSIGPNLSNIHTVHESMNISSVQRVYDYVCKVLEVIK